MRCNFRAVGGWRCVHWSHAECGYCHRACHGVVYAPGTHSASALQALADRLDGAPSVEEEEEAMIEAAEVAQKTHAEISAEARAPAQIFGISFWSKKECWALNHFTFNHIKEKN